MAHGRVYGDSHEDSGLNMKLGRVIGTVVSSTVYEGLDGVRFLVVQPLNSKMEDDGTQVVMADTVQAGPGDIILWVASREAALGMPETFVPIDAAIVGHVDAVGARSVAPKFEER